MEYVSAPHLYSHWRAVKHMLLHHIKNRFTILGTVCAIFARDEYQEDAGNLCHNHLMLAIRKDTVNPDSVAYLANLIWTPTFEIVKTNKDVTHLLESGLLKSVDEIPSIASRANTILKHVCNKRCYIRVGAGDGPENYRCRKMHSVKASPDTTRHNYISFRHEYQQASLDVLEEIGMYMPISNSISNGLFKHPFFDPMHHIAPCNFNAKCDSLPVICDFLS